MPGGGGSGIGDNLKRVWGMVDVGVRDAAGGDPKTTPPPLPVAGRLSWSGSVCRRFACDGVMDGGGWVGVALDVCVVVVKGCCTCELLGRGAIGLLLYAVGLDKCCAMYTCCALSWAWLCRICASSSVINTVLMLSPVVVTALVDGGIAATGGTAAVVAGLVVSGCCGVVVVVVVVGADVGGVRLWA